MRTCAPLLLAAAFVSRLALKMLGRRWERLPAAAEVYREQVSHPFEPDYEI